MALMTFEQLDRSIDADSDSDDELAEQAHMYRSMFFFLAVIILCSASPDQTSDVGTSQVTYFSQQPKLHLRYGRSQHILSSAPASSSSPAAPTLSHFKAAVSYCSLGKGQGCV